MSFSQGISGLQAAAAQLDAIGNNIANASTVGFKSGAVAFKDVIAGSRIGLGVSVADVRQDFNAGSVQMTSRPLDLAVTNGNGFFQVGSPDGSGVAYTRNGQFNVDKDGYIVSPQGMRLMGYGITATGTLAGGMPAALQFPTQSMTPRATGSVTAQFNLDSRTPDLNPAQFDPTNSASYTYSNALNVFDSLGNSHEVALYFVKTNSAAGQWSVFGTMGTQVLTSTPSNVTLTFDTSGAIQSGTPSSFTFSGAYGNGSAPANFTVDLAGSTQFGNTSAVQKLAQDGYTSGDLTSYDIGKDGVITGKYSNDQSKVLGQVVLTSFANVNALQPNGSNVFLQTGASGQPLTGAPGEGTTLGSITSGALEQSNVDLTSELVNLITAQRFYQANGQTLKTQDQVTQTLINMR